MTDEQVVRCPRCVWLVDARCFVSAYMKVEKGACVNDCESGHTPDENNVCVDCDGPCLKCESSQAAVFHAQFLGVGWRFRSPGVVKRRRAANPA